MYAHTYTGEVGLRVGVCMLVCAQAACYLLHTCHLISLLSEVTILISKIHLWTSRQKSSVNASGAMP